MSNKNIIIFDTTLRDGEQSLKRSLSPKAKLLIAKSLERLGVDYIEAGFPISSPLEFQSVQNIAKEVKGSIICGLARAVEKDIEACSNALKVAQQFRIHTFLATSPVHIEKKLKMSEQSAFELGMNAVKIARKFTDDVEFSCEDAGRTPIDSLCRFVEGAIKNGANTINIPDTVGYTIPEEFGYIIESIINRVPNIDKAVLSVHCHDDLGLSVANSLTAIQKGASQIEGTINGIGERAGNCALEEVILALHTRQHYFKKSTNINLNQIYRTSQLVSDRCQIPIQSNKAIVGENAFSHSSGIHQDGVIKNKETYEIVTPETIGLVENNLNMTARSGRHVIKFRLENLGYQEGKDYDIDNVYNKFLKLADKKGTVYDYDLETLIWMPNKQEDSYSLNYFKVISGNKIMATATVSLKIFDEVVTEASVGNGPIDALYNALCRVSGFDIKLEKYRVASKTEDQRALGIVDIVGIYNGKKYFGNGVSTDTTEASAYAFVDILNSIATSNSIQKIRKEKDSEKINSIETQSEWRL